MLHKVLGLSDEKTPVFQAYEREALGFHDVCTSKALLNRGEGK